MSEQLPEDARFFLDAVWWNGFFDAQRNRLGSRVNRAHNYVRLGPLLIDVMSISPYLLVAPAAGLFLHKADDDWLSVGLQIVLFIVLPALLYRIAPSFPALVMYDFAYSFTE